jgi:hypothetical protein
MAYSLRLPDTLDAAARAKADYLGISINALVCVALDAYLRSPDRPVASGSEPQPGASEPSKTSIQSPEPEPQKLTRAEKQAIYEQKKLERKALFGKR